MPDRSSGISMCLGENYFRSYPHCPVLVCSSVCQYSQRDRDIFSCKTRQVEIDVLQSTIAALSPLTERFKDTSLFIVQLKLDIPHTTSSICFGKETNFRLEM